MKLHDSYHDCLAFIRLWVMMERSETSRSLDVGGMMV